MTPAGCLASVFGCSGPDLTAGEASFFRDAAPWGFILFARNIDTPDRLRRLTAALRDAVGWQAPVLIDQEGGRVQRMRAPYWREWPAPLDHMLAAGENAERVMYLRARLIAHDLHSAGIDVNCTPTLDIARAETHPFLRNRTLADCADTVATLGRAAVQGQLDGGVLSVIKHIPGHGRAVADSHLELPRVDTPLDVLRATDFAPFKALSKVPLGMSAHVVYSALDPVRPGTTSPAVVSEIRNFIGFDGLLLTDDLSMKALPGDVPARVTDSLRAGCDVILHCNGDPAEMAAVAATVGPLSAAAVVRSDRALAQRRTPAPLDIDALTADLEALVP
jgi:beta-N-acetylhexosaminidase